MYQTTIPAKCSDNRHYSARCHTGSCWYMPSMPSDFTGPIMAGDRHHPTGTTEGNHHCCTCGPRASFKRKLLTVRSSMRLVFWLGRENDDILLVSTVRSIVKRPCMVHPVLYASHDELCRSSQTPPPLRKNGNLFHLIRVISYHLWMLPGRDFWSDAFLMVVTPKLDVCLDRRLGVSEGLRYS